LSPTTSAFTVHVLAPLGTKVAETALLRPRRSAATWENAGSHSGEPSIADKDEVPGSSPGRPTNHRPRSQRCWQRAGAARCRLGPRWGRTPIPAGASSGPLRVRPPGRQARRRPPTVVAHPAEDGSHAAAAATSCCSLLPCPQRRRRDGLRTPAWPARSLSGQAQPPRPAPNPAARVRHRPPPDQRDFGSVARVPASSTVDRVVDGPAAIGPPPVPVVTVARPARPGPNATLSMGGDGPVRTDGGRPQTAGHRTGGQQTAGQRTAGRWMGQQTADRRTLWTMTPGDRTPDGWTAGSRTPIPDGWTPPAGHRRPTPWLACWQCRPRRRRPTSRSGWTLLRADAVWASNNQDRSAARTPRASTLLRTGLATAATVSCRWYAAGQLAPWRTAVLRRLRVERRANGEASSVNGKGVVGRLKPR
jgi:hypothetical protein